MRGVAVAYYLGSGKRTSWSPFATTSAPPSDEFAICNGRPYLNQSTPPMVTIVAYDTRDLVTALAVFTPVPCRMYGSCDSLALQGNVEEPDFVDHDAGLRRDLADVGQSAHHHDYALPSMHQRMIDALSVELEHRFGAPVWRDEYAYGTRWATADSDIGLFVLARGRWVIETHELHHGGPPGATP